MVGSLHLQNLGYYGNMADVMKSTSVTKTLRHAMMAMFNNQYSI